MCLISTRSMRQRAWELHYILSVNCDMYVAVCHRPAYVAVVFTLYILGGIGSTSMGEVCWVVLVVWYWCWVHVARGCQPSGRPSQHALDAPLLASRIPLQRSRSPVRPGAAGSPAQRATGRAPCWTVCGGWSPNTQHIEMPFGNKCINRRQHGEVDCSRLQLLTALALNKSHLVMEMAWGQGAP